MIRSWPSAIWHAAAAATAVMALAGLAGAPPPGIKSQAKASVEALQIQPQAVSQTRTLIPIEVLRVIDGDTIEVRAHVWLDQTIATRVRLRGIDAPEFRTGCTAEAARAEASRNRLAVLVGGGNLYLTAIARDKYGGRVVGDLVAPDGTSIAQAMLTSGHARSYAGGKRQTWC